MSEGYQGRIDGNFDVDAHGGAVYTIGITVPPGPGGLQPALRLAYNSHASELGYLGVGWRLTGLSQISRVAATLAQDGFIGRVDYGATDRFALDGARLVTVEGEYGSAGAVYRTEVEQWTKVVPSSSGVPGRSGPDSFTAYAKDRTRYEFGTTEDSRVLANTAPGKAPAPSVRTWLVSRITDRNGNQIVFRYDRDLANNTAYPLAIAWGGNERTDAKPQREIRFTYGPLTPDSPDAAVQFLGGFGFATMRRLETISTHVNDKLALRYRLAWARDGITRRGRVTSVTLEDSTGQALPATKFAWQDGAPSFFGPASSVTTSAEMRGSFIPMDVNGDGIIDIVNARADRGNLVLDLRLGRPDGTFGEPVSIPVSGLAADAMLLPLDIDADGCTDLVHARSERDELVITVFHARQVDGRWTLVQGPKGGGGPKELRSTKTLLPVDYDGDGRIDLVHGMAEKGKLVLRPLRSNGMSFVHDAATRTETELPWGDGMLLLPLDFDGDGKGDLVYARKERDALRIRMLRSDGNRFIPEAADADIGEVPFTRILFASDTNGDGKPDLIAARLNQGKLELRTMLSNGVGLERPQLSTFALSADAMPRLLPVRLTGGLPDLIVQFLERDAARLRVLSSNGATFVERAGVAQPFQKAWLGATLLPADVDGDGRTDLLAIGRGAVDDPRVTFTTARVAGAIPDLVHGVSDGYGEHVSIEYKPLTDASVYRKAGTPESSADPRALALRGVSGATFDLVGGDSTIGASHTTMNVQFAKQVVSAYERPATGPARFRFEQFYGGARIDLRGRGWLGFATMQIVDRGRGTKRLTWYRQDFPFGGSPQRTELRSASDDRLFEQTTLEHHEVVRGKVHEPQLLVKRRSVFGGPAASTSADLVETTEYKYDDLGNPTLEATSVSGAKSQPLFVHHVYGDRDLAAWNLGTEREWKRTADRDGKDVLLHRRFVYDARANRTAEEVWDGGFQRWLTTKYEHDDYGNEVTMVTASGAVSRTVFDAELHTFPMRTIQPANAAGVSLITDHEHDPRNGVEIATSLPYVAGSTPRPKAKQELDGLGRVMKKLGLAPGGQLVPMSTIVRGHDATGPYEEERTLETWDGQSWRHERKYFTSTGSNFRTTALAPDAKRETVVERIFDSDGRTLEETLLRHDGAPARSVRRVYDVLGRLVRLERPLPNGRTTIAETLCLSANVEESTEGVGTPLARKTRREYGVFAGNRSIVKRVDALGGITTYDYDAAGRATRAVDPNGVVTTAAYDFSDRQTALEVRAGDRVQTSERSDYDDVRRQTERTDGRGIRVRFSYDAMQRLVSRGTDDGQPMVLTYDDVSRPNTLSRLASVSMPDGVRLDYDYDAHANRTRETVTIDGSSHETQFAYSPSARTESITYPDGSIVRNRYNAAGSLLSVAAGDGTVYAEYGDFSPFGKPQAVNLLNKTRELLPYNDVGQLVSQSIVRGDGSAIASSTIHWNDVYQLDRIGDVLDERKTQTFSYDAAGRLVRATGDYDEQLFAYDKAGNLTRKGNVNFEVEGYQLRSGRQSEAEVYRASYDANGNVTGTQRGGQRREFRFDADSHLVESNGTTFQYDHEGARLAKKSADGTRTYYIGPHFEVAIRPDGTRQTTAYIRGGQGLVASKTTSAKAAVSLLAGVPSPGLHFFHTNHINSTTVQTDTNGHEVCRIEYLPFGEIHRITGQDTFRQKFTGNELDYETGLYYFKTRYYDATIGRFVSADDRLGGDLDGRDVFNRYAYVLNNPVADFDPEGHASGWAIFAGVMMGLAVVGGVALTIASAGIAAPAVAAAVSTLGGIIAGGAASAATYSFTHMDNFDARDMGIQFGIGAAVGAVGTGISSLGMKALGVAVEMGVNAAAKITATQIAKMALVEAFSGFVVGALYSGLQNAANNQSFNVGDAAVRGGWGAAGGLVAGGVLGSVARSTQKDVYNQWQLQRDVWLDQQYLIKLPTNIYVAKAVQGLVHVPRVTFGKIAGLGFEATA